METVANGTFEGYKRKFHPITEPNFPTENLGSLPNGHTSLIQRSQEMFRAVCQLSDGEHTVRSPTIPFPLFSVRYDLVNLLLTHGADVNCYFRVISNTLFPTALQYCLRDPVMLRLLLNSGYQAQKSVACSTFELNAFHKKLRACFSRGKHALRGCYSKTHALTLWPCDAFLC